MPDWLNPTPQKTNEQLQRESDAARRLERQRDKDAQREQDDMEDTPGQTDRQPGSRKKR